MSQEVVGINLESYGRRDDHMVDWEMGGRWWFEGELTLSVTSGVDGVPSGSLFTFYQEAPVRH